MRRNKQKTEAELYTLEANLSYLKSLKDEKPDLGELVRALAAKKVAAIYLAAVLEFKKEAKDLSKEARLAFDKWSERILVEDIADVDKTSEVLRQESSGCLGVSVLKGAEL